MCGSARSFDDGIPVETGHLAFSSERKPHYFLAKGCRWESFSVELETTFQCSSLVRSTGRTLAVPTFTLIA